MEETGEARARSWPVNVKDCSLKYFSLLELLIHISKLVMTFEVEERATAYCRIPNLSKCNPQATGRPRYARSEAWVLIPFTYNPSNDAAKCGQSVAVISLEMVGYTQQSARLNFSMEADTG